MIHYSKYQRHILGLALFGGITLAHPMSAYAIPSFAAQTGEPCSACHIGFPQLTAFGREFKLQGYVAGGMFPQIKNLAVMSQIGYTALHSKVPGGLAPDYPSNNAYSIQQTSLFFGGALYEPLGLGAFIQTTYDGVAHQLHWDNTDIRMTRAASLFDKPLFYGFTFNNNPGVTDLWNTPPSWGYPFITAELGVGSAASVQLSSLAQSVSGIGTYGALNLTPGDMIYAEADIYKSLPNRTAYALGVGPASVLDGSAPYWRLAYQHSWAGSSVEIGTIGLLDHPYPSGFTHGPSDELLDVGLDSQIQWINANHALSFQAAYIHEHQHWSASYPLGLTANPNDTLDTLTLTISYLLHQKYGVTGTYNQISGNADQALYAASPIGGSANNKPNTTSYTTELDYYPFNTGGPKFFPWVNAKFFVENTIYTQFNGLARNYDGSGRNAQGNDVLFTGIWLAF